MVSNVTYHSSKTKQADMLKLNRRIRARPRRKHLPIPHDVASSNQLTFLQPPSPPSLTPCCGLQGGSAGLRPAHTTAPSNPCQGWFQRQWNTPVTIRTHSVETHGGLASPTAPGAAHSHSAFEVLGNYYQAFIMLLLLLLLLSWKRHRVLCTNSDWFL